MKAVLFEKFQTPPKVVNVEDPTPDAHGVNKCDFTKNNRALLIGEVLLNMFRSIRLI